MKKMLLMVALVMAAVMIPATAFAAVPGTWNPTWENAGVSLDSSGGKVTLNAKGKDAWVSTFTSPDAVEPNGYTWEFQLKVPTVYSQQPHPEIADSNFDLWYGLGLNDGVQSTLGSSGLYVLVKPIAADTTRFSVFARNVDDQREYDSVDLKLDPTSKMKVQLVKDGDKWSLLVNGKALKLVKGGVEDGMAHLTAGFESLGQGGKAFPYAGIFSQVPYEEMDAAITFTTMETQEVKAPAAGADTAGGGEAAPANPKTGDAGTMSYMAAALLCAAGLVFFMKRKAVR